MVSDDSRTGWENEKFYINTVTGEVMINVRVMNFSATASKGSTVSMVGGDATKTDTIQVPATVCVITRITLDFSNHNRSNTIAIERDNSADAKQEDIVDTTDKWQDSGLIDFPCHIICAASDKIKLTITNTGAVASNLDWRIDFIQG